MSRFSFFRFRGFLTFLSVLSRETKRPSEHQQLTIFKKINRSSTNGGLTWAAQTNSALSAKNWAAVASNADGTKLAAMEFGGAIWLSSNSGGTWTSQPAGTGANAFPATANWAAVALSATGTEVMAAASGGKLWRTATFGGANAWTVQTGAPVTTAKAWASVASSSDGLVYVAGVDSGALVYSNTLNTWTATTGAPASGRWMGIASSANGQLAIAADGTPGNLWQVRKFFSMFFIVHLTLFTGLDRGDRVIVFPERARRERGKASTSTEGRSESKSREVLLLTYLSRARGSFRAAAPLSSLSLLLPTSTGPRQYLFHVSLRSTTLRSQKKTHDEKNKKPIVHKLRCNLGGARGRDRRAQLRCLALRRDVQRRHEARRRRLGWQYLVQLQFRCQLDCAERRIARFGCLARRHDEPRRERHGRDHRQWKYLASVGFFKKVTSSVLFLLSHSHSLFVLVFSHGSFPLVPLTLSLSSTFTSSI